ncbi:MAG: Rieske (2Fe-2S) protein [Solirubrobacteraceae bacterium]
MGTNHAFLEHPPADWTPVLGDADLADGQLARVDAAGAAVLVYRSKGQIYEISSRCSHAGGPLDDGSIDESSSTVSAPGTRARSASPAGTSSTVPPACLRRPTTYASRKLRSRSACGSDRAGYRGASGGSTATSCAPRRSLSELERSSAAAADRRYSRRLCRPPLIRSQQSARGCRRSPTRCRSPTASRASITSTSR